MIVARFLYLTLAAAAVAAVSAALLAQGIVNRRSSEFLTDQLLRDRAEIEAMLRLEARSRLDRIAFVATDAKLAATLRRAGAATDAKALRQLSLTAKERLSAHNRQIKKAVGDAGTPDIVFAVDSRGVIVAQLGPMQANPPGAGLGTFPLVRRALLGYERDDVWLYDRQVYRMAARPIIYGGAYVGAVVHGYRFDAAFAQKLGKALRDASVVFFYGAKLLASYSPPEVNDAPSATRLAGSLPEVVNDASFSASSEPRVKELGEHARAVYSPVTGSAARAKVGYAVARPLRVLSDPLALFRNATRADINALPWVYLAIALLALVVLGMLSIYMERDRPFGRLRSSVSEIVRGERDRLDVSAWRGAYRGMASALNRALDASCQRASHPGSKPAPAANIDELLGSSHVATSQPFFGFAHERRPTPRAGAQAAARSTPIQPAAKPPNVPRPPPPPGPSATGAAQAAVPGVGHSNGNGATMGKAAAPAPESTSAAGFDEEVHFREIYDEYLATRKQCNESVEGLTFDRFAKTLRRNRDQIRSAHGAKAVRFTVYVKSGKAALRASPLR
ncbi:MAG: hypothetical protein MJD61_20590 [Proteobacteria bacterium]|nr:hypothetical protein [Pseudomonadota bacterium]